MKTTYIQVLLAIFSIIVLGCTKTIGTGAIENKDAMMDKKESDAMAKDANIIEKGQESMEKEGLMIENSAYTGKVLAGTATKYIEFNNEDYQRALKEKKKILLYFYANWCPICKAEQQDTFAAFEELNDNDLIGFRVNYRDGDDDDFEKELAKEFGVSYQHTKVVLKDGQKVLKAPDSWNKQRYLDELARI